MKFTDLDDKMQDDIVALLNNHVAASADILRKERRLLPMLTIPDKNRTFALQPKGIHPDIDKAYDLVVETLKKESFSYALFSYSTRIGLDTGAVSDALKTYIFTASGIEVSFYTPYTVKGLFKKTLNVEKSLLADLKENVFA